MTEKAAHKGADDIAAAALPPVLAGPLLRRATPECLVFWLVCSDTVSIRLRLQVDGEQEPLIDRLLQGEEVSRIRFGEHAFLYLLEVRPETLLPENVRISYDLGVIRDHTDELPSWIAHWAPHLCLPGNDCPDFVLKTRIDRLLHGSCRRPHHAAADGMTRADDELLRTRDLAQERPAMLLLTGDQIYADDVAGPLLRAIHCLIRRLGLYQETLEGALIVDSQALLEHRDTYYRRERLLPATPSNEALIERFFGGVRKPVFTSDNAHNHMISLAEVMAMYLLVWSPTPWGLISATRPSLDEEDARQYEREQVCIDGFVATLPRAARALAHLPTYMIFDDHDVTDDWNLSVLWEESAYGHPFSRRIIGNALIAYLLCQAWGNNPGVFADVIPQLDRLLNRAEPDAMLDSQAHDQLISRLLAFESWHYALPTRPRLVVLNTRTRRWRRELTPSRPSGLMSWEALTEFQQMIMDEKSVIVVSPAPMFGVKLIEAIQRTFTFFGRPLMVDAENWMAHPGAANVLLNIFAHSRTPQNFVILSGDVHYSFAYDVRLRHKDNAPRIWQITSSGLKNQFPNTLLEWLDRLNRWLYAPWSPLNWFTKRRRMRVTPRLPDAREAGERLWNRAGIGLVELDDEGVPTLIRELAADGSSCLFRKSAEDED